MDLRVRPRNLGRTRRPIPRRGNVMSTAETGDDSALHVPAEILPAEEPLMAIYLVDTN